MLDSPMPDIGFKRNDGIDQSPGAVFGVGPRNPRHPLDVVTNADLTLLMRAFSRVLCHTVSHDSVEWARDPRGSRIWTLGSHVVVERDAKDFARLEAEREVARRRDIAARHPAPEIGAAYAPAPPRGRLPYVPANWGRKFAGGRTLRAER